MRLRQYQVDAIDQIDKEIREGKTRILLCAAPGAGKTMTAASMIKRAIKYDFPVVFIVRGRNLVHNAADRFKMLGIDFSVAMAGDWRFNQSKLLQICSIDTMKARGLYPYSGKQSIVLIDEAHLDYSSVFEMYPNSIIVGMTGTPYSDMSAYDSFVESIAPYELREQGYLVPDKIYCPHIMDTSQVKVVRGDFDRKQLNNVVTNSAVIGNVVQDWIDLGEGRPTVCFAVGVDHSMQIAQAFRDAGINAVHCDAKSSDEDRVKAREGLENGTIKVVCNVDIFSTGWDCPAVGCIILARPTWSLNWYLQAVGRGVRAFPGKDNCIVLDNAGNVFRHGTHFKVRDITLDKPEKRKKSKEYDNKVKTCEACYYIFDPSIYRTCPDCGWEIPVNGRKVTEIDGKLVEYSEHEDDRVTRRKAMVIQKYRDLERFRRSRNYREVWVYAQLMKDFSRQEIAHLNLITKVPSQFLPLQEAQ